MKCEDGSPAFSGICAFSVFWCSSIVPAAPVPRVSQLGLWLDREDWAGVCYLGMLHGGLSKSDTEKRGDRKGSRSKFAA